MNKNIAKISFYFPKISHRLKNKQELVDLIDKLMRGDGNIKRTGYLKEKSFYKELYAHIGNNISTYSGLSSKQKKFIEKNIRVATEKCHHILPHPDLPIFIFVYPWFPGKEDKILFQGTTAFAAYYTIHLFIDLDGFTNKSIQETIAHEWNHLVFYRYHSEQRHALKAHMVMEGMAEVFREEVAGGKPSPWSVALTKAEANRQLKLLTPKLDKKGLGIYKEIFFGNKKYKRWTGYSIGYWFVKNFRKKNRKVSWEKIIKIKSEDILAIPKKKGHNV